MILLSNGRKKTGYGSRESRLNRIKLQSLFRNLSVRFWAIPILFFLYFFYISINPGHLDILLLGSALALSLAVNTVFYMLIRRKLKNKGLEQLVHELKVCNLANIGLDIVLLSFVIPYIGGLNNPFSIVFLMELVVLTVLFNVKYAIGGAMIFLFAQFLFFINKLPLKYANISSQNDYFFYLIIYLFVSILLIFTVEVLIKPIFFDNKEFEHLKDQEEMLKQNELRNAQYEFLTKITADIVSAQSIEKILKNVVEGVKNVLRCEVVLLSLFEKQERIYKRATYAGLTDSEWAKVKEQRIPMDFVNQMLNDNFKIRGGYFIPGSFVNRFDPEYVLTVSEKAEVEKLKEGDWHPEDILLFPILGRSDEMLGYFTVDKPLNRKIPSDDVLNELIIFIHTAGFAIQNVLDLQELNYLNRKLRTVYTVNEMITKLSNEQDYINKVVKIIKESLGYTNVAILLKDGDFLKIAASIGYNTHEIKDRQLKVGRDGITGWVAANKMAQIVNDVEKDPRYVKGAVNTRSELAVPIKFGVNEIMGVMDFESDKYNYFTPRDMELLSMVANQLGIALKNNELYNRTLELAKIDEMTKLFNYRYFRTALTAEVIRAKRYSHPFSLVILDIDNFKSINDTYGHPQGDLVLKKLADTMKYYTRDTDIVARYGGEEFVIIFPETEKKFAEETANRLRVAISETKVPFLNREDKFITITVSMGIATFIPAMAINDEDLISAADNALYMAKKGGKNRVVVN